MKPKILLSTSQSINRAYLDAVLEAGGIPEAIYAPCTHSQYDALILCGGADIDPARYFHENTASVGIDPLRDEREFELFNEFMQKGKPIFGICRGHQLINVALGAPLVQHIKHAERHSSGISGKDLTHEIIADENGFVGKLYGTKFTSNSSHHQGVVTLAKGLRAVAWTDDGSLIEAMEHLCFPIMSVQWHPERTCCEYLRSDCVNGLEVFEYFIELCRKN